jgi:NAD(P)-dependent dehydrogenase (short-subunit alcohol dehydrogenase family)
MMRSLESQRNLADPRAVHDANSANTPTGRYATPEEVANAVMYLCTDLASDITGTHLVIDGGRSGIDQSSICGCRALRCKVNAVCPGPVETRMMRSLESQRNPADPRAVHDANSANTPTGRYATPEEVANAVMYLCSDLASDITGTHLVIDGGRSESGGAPSGTRR